MAGVAHREMDAGRREVAWFVIAYADVVNVNPVGAARCFADFYADFAADVEGEGGSGECFGGGDGGVLFCPVGIAVGGIPEFPFACCIAAVGCVEDGYFACSVGDGEVHSEFAVIADAGGLAAILFVFGGGAEECIGEEPCPAGEMDGGGGVGGFGGGFKGFCLTPSLSKGEGEEKNEESDGADFGFHWWWFWFKLLFRADTKQGVGGITERNSHTPYANPLSDNLYY